MSAAHPPSTFTMPAGEAQALPEELRVSFPLAFTKSHLEIALKALHAADVSDIYFQSEDRVFVRWKGRMLAVTARVLSATEVQSALVALSDMSTTGMIAGGKDIQRRVSIFINRDTSAGFRMNAVGCLIGNLDRAISITLRRIPEAPPTIDTLQLPQEILDNIFPKYGLVLITGITGSGKSTLLGSVNRWRLEHGEPIRMLTYEEPVEFNLGGLARGRMPEPSQVEIPFHLHNWADTTPNAMRRAGDVILMGEIRDVASASAGMSMAETGHCCEATMHNSTPASAIKRMTGFFPPEQSADVLNRLLDTLSLIVSQKLVVTTDGVRRPLRSWCVFGQELKDELSKLDGKDWPRAVHDDCVRRRADFTSQALNWYRTGLITAKDLQQLGGMSLKEALHMVEQPGNQVGDPVLEAIT